MIIKSKGQPRLSPEFLVPNRGTMNLQRVLPPGPVGLRQLMMAKPPATVDVARTAIDIIGAQEGNYDTVVKDDNGALSIGKIQWHGVRARDLLRDLNSKNVPLPKTIIDDLQKSPQFWEGNNDKGIKGRILSDSEKEGIVIALRNPISKKLQDDLATADIPKYIAHGRELGIGDDRVLVYFADLENQGGPGGARDAVKRAGGGVGLTLDALYAAALKTPGALGTDKDRRRRVYNRCKTLWIHEGPWVPSDFVDIG